MISFQNEGKQLPDFDMNKIFRWLSTVAGSYDKIIGDLTYKFCGDDEILKANRDFLNHDYYTDIITFDYTLGKKVGADILISTDTVATNSKEFNVSYDEELLRVIVHGLLHLCGLKDKTVKEREIMEEAENKALKLYNSL